MLVYIIKCLIGWV